MEHGVAQGFSLSSILLSVFINGLLREVEEAEIRIHLSMVGDLEDLCLQMTLLLLVSLRISYRNS